MPLTDSEVIDAALRFHVSAGSTSVQFDQRQRDRARHTLQLLSDECLSEAPFWLRLGSSSITLTPGVATASAPPDYGYIDQETHLYIAGRQLPLRFADADIISGYRETNPRMAIPELYCQQGISGATGVPTFLFYPTPNQAYTIDVLQYVKRFPDIVDRPGALTSAVGGAGAVTGSGYIWKVTFVTPLGECEAGVPSTPAINLVAQRGTLTNIPVSQVHRVTSRKIYRNASGTAGPFKLVGTIADNVTTTFDDNITDGGLGANAPDVTTAITGMSQYTEDFHLTVFVAGLAGMLVPPVKKDSKVDWLRTVKKRWAEHKQGQNFPQVLPPYGAMAGPVRAASWRYRIS